MAELLCRNEVEMHAAAASRRCDADTSPDPAALAAPGPQSEAGPEAKGPALPQWDCNDGDTWHKRQRVSTFRLCLRIQRSALMVYEVSVMSLHASFS